MWTLEEEEEEEEDTQTTLHTAIIMVRMWTECGRELHLHANAKLYDLWRMLAQKKLNTLSH